MRRLYAPLLLLLAVVVVVGVVNQGKGHSTNNPAHAASAPRSVFPSPSAVPTVATPTATVPTPTVNTQPIAPPGRACQSLHVDGRSVSVRILQGEVTCGTARAVLLAFKSGKGKPGGGPGKGRRTVDGWTCVASGTCTRPGETIKAS